jgi:hypothetical protein
MATVNIRQKASIPSVILFWKRFIVPRETERHQAPFLRLNSFDVPATTKAMLKFPSMITPEGTVVNQNVVNQNYGAPARSPGQYG